MCYSIGVQLTTSLIILASAIIYFFYYKNKFKSSEKKWIIPFLYSSIGVFLCIGLHQFFEFLSLLTNNTIVYKIGLIISICSVYFFIRSLEILSNTKLYSWISIIPIIIVSLQIIFSPLTFSSASFYLQHNSAGLWAIVWLLFFIYWNICAFKIYSEIKDDKSRRTILIYLLTIADISFILSMIYVFIGYFLFSVNVCTDSPSIWCTFYVIQSFLIPILFFRLGNSFKRTNKQKKIKIKQIILYLLLSLLILLLLILILPLFNCLSWKLVFP